MRVVLTPVLEQRFYSAWAMVPQGVQTRLVQRLSVCAMTRGHYVLNGRRDPNAAEGVFDVQTFTVWLRTRLARRRRGYAVAVILHELAHALQAAMKDARPRSAGGRGYGLRHERHAHGLAALWLRMADSLLAREALAELGPFIRRDGRPSIHRRL